MEREVIDWSGFLSLFNRHVLTGSYHNFFRIYDTDTLNDVVLQADKSAFKAKKIGGPLPGNKNMRNGPKGVLRDTMQLDALDFNKKILHASWHPRENTIAVIILFLASILENTSWYFVLDRCYKQSVSIQCCMIDWVLALLISDIRHSDLAHQGMTSNATYSTHPPLITFILIILSHFTPWPVFDVIRQSCLLWDDVSSNRSIKGQDKVQAVNISFCSSFCLLVLSKRSCSMRMLPFYRCKPCPAINSLNRVLFSSVILFGVFAPWVWLPILFSVAFSSVLLSVLFSGFIYDYVFLLSADALFIPSHTIWFRGLRLRWMDYSATRRHFWVDFSHWKLRW